jgi:hypothetical protein
VVLEANKLTHIISAIASLTTLSFSEATFKTVYERMRAADGGTVAKVLRYKSEGRWFDSRWCNWNFSLT